MNCSSSRLFRLGVDLFGNSFCIWFATTVLATALVRAEDVGERWGTEEREREFYPIVNIPLPKDTVIEAGAFAVLPDGRIAVGTRHGEIYLIDGIDAGKPAPSFHRFASGLDEIFGLTWQDGAFRVTQSCEVTRLSDSNGDGVADRFETISDAWGYANYHEYAFGSKLDAAGNQFVALGLSESYYSNARRKDNRVRQRLAKSWWDRIRRARLPFLHRESRTMELFVQFEIRSTKQLSWSSC
ncbi:MAG: hypothetical protein MUF23_17915 [Pirellula sp.]|nr:hypothetical protein [Pirellula sp.]